MTSSSNSSSSSTVEQLLSAAAEEFAERGYEGTRIHNIVKRAKLTTGAVYRHFKNKNDLLHAAIVAAAPSRRLVLGKVSTLSRVSEVLKQAGRLDYVIDEQLGMLLEALVCARRVPEIAASVKETHSRWLDSVMPLVEQGMKDGSLDDSLDPEALAIFFRIVGLGSMLYLSAGLEPPDLDKWDAVIAHVSAGLGPQ